MANTFTNKKSRFNYNKCYNIIYSAYATTAIIKSILVSEDSGNADTITVTITDTADAVFSLLRLNLYQLMVQQNYLQLL